MKEKKNFSEWCVAIFAFFAKHLFPTLSVFYGTKKENKYARYFVPSVNAQIRVVERFDFTDEEINARVWSRKAMLQMVQWRKRNIFVNYLTAEDEDILNRLCDCRNWDVVARALKVAKPSKKYLQDLVNKREQGFAIAIRCLSLFDNFSMAELPENKRDALLREFLMLDGSKSENQATIVHWAQEVFKAYGDMPKPNLSEDQQKLLELAFKALRAMDYDMTDRLLGLQKYHPELFAEIQLNSRHIVAYLEKALPRMARQYYEAEHPVKKELEPALVEKLEQDSKEAQRWLKKAKENISKPRIQKVLMTDIDCKEELLSPWGIWTDIREALFIAVSDYDCIKLAMKFSPADYQAELEQKLVMAVKTSGQAEEALSLVNQKYAGKLIQKMVQFLEPGLDEPMLLKYYPFNGWFAEVRRSALHWLVEQNAIPSRRIAELDEEMKTFVKEEMSVKSEIEGLKSRATAEELINYRLHAKAEKTLFFADYKRMKELAFLYVQKNCMADESFYALVNTRTVGLENSEEEFARLIELHAMMHGLSERNLADLLQSPYYAYLTSMLRIYSRQKRCA